jgi:hypothetical protein
VLDVEVEAPHGGRGCGPLIDSEVKSFGQRFERVAAEPFLIAFRIDPTFSFDFNGGLSGLGLFAVGDFAPDALPSGLSESLRDEVGPIGLRGRF